MPHGPLERVVGCHLAASLRTATLFELDGRTLDAAKGTEDAAVARQWLQQFVTPLALVEEDARIGGHFFLCVDSAFRAGDDGVQRYFHGASNDI
jgi:hypothetical protein